MNGILENPIFMYLLIFVVFYLFFIRPQLKRSKEEKKFRVEIGKGSNVVMTSGIHGKIVEINEENGTLLLETKAGRIKFERSAISMEMSKKHMNAGVTKK